MIPLASCEKRAKRDDRPGCVRRSGLASSDTCGEGIEERIYSRNETLHAPHLLDLEVTQVLRRLALQRMVAVRRVDEAVRDLLDLRITRYPHLVLLSRIWQLRHNLSAYDAAYIVLAEKLRAALITRDGRLLSASGHAAAIELF